jgi:dUTP pyrophosphatase
MNSNTFTETSMDIFIKRLDQDMPLPEYQTLGSVGFDLYARSDTIIEPKSLGLIANGVIIEVPEGYMLLLASRSSTPRKKGLHTPHGLGIIDHDYCGETDEIMTQVYNPSEKVVLIKKGERVSQAIIVPILRVNMKEKKSMHQQSRGGFGSTDNNKNI